MKIRLQVPHVLYVDNDSEQCQAFRYALIDHAEVFTAQTPEEALRLLEAHPEITIIVTDLHLSATTDSVQFLRRAHEVRSGMVNILVTAGLNDAQLLAQAVNSGLVWSVWNKTDEDYIRELPQIIAQAAVEQARRQVEIVLALAVREVVRTLVQRTENPENGQVARREHLAQLMAPYLDLTALELAFLPFAALLHGLENVAGGGVRELLGDMPAAVPALRPLSHSLEDARERFDGIGPQGKRGEQIAVLARVIAVVDQCDRLMAAAIASGSSVTDAISQTLDALQTDAGKWFDPSVVTALQQMVGEHRDAVKRLYWKAN